MIVNLRSAVAKDLRANAPWIEAHRKGWSDIVRLLDEALTGGRPS